MTKNEFPGIEDELADFGVVGPGPRRTLNFTNNRRPASGGCALVASLVFGKEPFGGVLPEVAGRRGGSMADGRESCSARQSH